jgi:transglutaminase-like putative cysteine protease
MSIHVALHHKTHYRYDRWVSLGPQVVRLRPAPHCRTPILSYSLKIQPREHFINWQQDPQSNYLARLVFPEKARELFIEVDLVAKLDVLNPFDFFLEPGADFYPFTYDKALRKELRPYLEVEPAGPLLASFLENVPKQRTRTIDFLVDLNRRLQQEIQYVIRLAPGVQTCEETLQLRRGSCRTRLAIGPGLAPPGWQPALRRVSHPTHSGCQTAGWARRPSADFTDLHAWTEVYLPGAGWIGLDPTSGLLAGEGHIPLACSPDPASAAP